MLLKPQPKREKRDNTPVILERPIVKLLQKINPNATLYELQARMRDIEHGKTNEKQFDVAWEHFKILRFKALTIQERKAQKQKHPWEDHTFQWHLLWEAIETVWDYQRKRAQRQEPVIQIIRGGLSPSDEGHYKVNS